MSRQAKEVEVPDRHVRLGHSCSDGCQQDQGSSFEGPAEYTQEAIHPNLSEHYWLEGSGCPEDVSAPDKNDHPQLKNYCSCVDGYCEACSGVLEHGHDAVQDSLPIGYGGVPEMAYVNPIDCRTTWDTLSKAVCQTPSADASETIRDMNFEQPIQHDYGSCHDNDDGHEVPVPFTPQQLGPASTETPSPILSSRVDFSSIGAWAEGDLQSHAFSPHYSSQMQSRQYAIENCAICNDFFGGYCDVHPNGS